MKIRKILSLVFASALLFNVACTSDDENVIIDPPHGAYENGIFITDEGGFSTPTSEISFINNDLGTLQSKIYSGNNNEPLGNVLQSVGFDGNLAYLVSNVPNKIEIVNRYTFKKQTTVTSNLVNPRYIAFSGNQYYVTNNNFSNVKKLNVYNKDNSFVKSINFDRLAEKVVEANGNIIVQTDGITYEATPPYNELATGYTVTIVSPATNAVSKTVTLPSNGIIRDLTSYNGYAYVLASDNTNSYIYTINPLSGTFTTTTLTGIAQVKKLSVDTNKFYFINTANKIYVMQIGSPTPSSPLVSAGNIYAYGFNVIDGKIFVSDASFTSDSKVYVYSTSNGSLLKTFNTGIGTNGFYKN